MFFFTKVSSSQNFNLENETCKKGMNKKLCHLDETDDDDDKNWGSIKVLGVFSQKSILPKNPSRFLVLSAFS